MNKNKKRKAAPLVAGLVKVAKGEEKQVPKIEAVDAPTKAPKYGKEVKEEEREEKKEERKEKRREEEGRGGDEKGGIEMWYVEREMGAKVVKKVVEKSGGQEGEERRGGRARGLEIMERGTAGGVGAKCRDFLKWFLWPLPIDEFFNAYWEKRVFVMKRNEPKYWDGWFSSGELRSLVEEGRLAYGSDIDVTMYKDGQRFTLNVASDEAAQGEVLWDLFEKTKCSVRVLRPQEYASNVSRMLALLEESFLSGFGCNAYYTPRGSQGFAPHWDDVEAFVLQVEGQKTWRIHALGGDDEILPRFSSRNLHPSEAGPCVLQVTLSPGDLLYFPRGTIHQAQSDSLSDSFHLTVSTAQKNCWADLMDIAVNAALIQASKDMPAFRSSLPRDYGNFMGVMHSDRSKDEKRKQFMRTAMALVEAFAEKFLPQQIDDAADKMLCRFLYDRQPPQAMLSSDEQGISPPSTSLVDDDDDDDNDIDIDHKDSPSSSMPGLLPSLKGPQPDDDDDIDENTKIRLVSKHCCRLVVEELASLYYASANTPKYHEVDSMKITMPLEYAEAIEHLVEAYPKYVAVKDLPLETEEERLDLANELLDHQIAMVE